MCWRDHRGDLRALEANTLNTSGDREILDSEIDSSNKSFDSPDLQGLSLT